MTETRPTFRETSRQPEVEKKLKEAFADALFADEFVSDGVINDAWDVLTGLDVDSSTVPELIDEFFLTYNEEYDLLSVDAEERASEWLEAYFESLKAQLSTAEDAPDSTDADTMDDGTASSGKDRETIDALKSSITNPDTSTSTYTPEATKDASVLAPEAGSASKIDKPVSYAQRAKGMMDAVFTKTGVKNVWGRFKRSWTGEVAPEKQEVGKLEVAYITTTMLMDVGARVTGLRLPVDVLQKVSQKIFVGKERARLMTEIEALNKEFEESVKGMDQSGKKWADLFSEVVEKHAKAIDASTFLTEQEKEKVLQSAKTGQKKAIEEAVFAFVQEKKTSSEIGKQAMNTALFWSGMGLYRSAVYGLSSLGERSKAKYEELKKSGELSTKRFAQEVFVNGVWETIHKLKGGDAKNWRDRAKNRVEALGVLATAFGVVTTDYSGGSEAVKSQIDDLLNYFEEQTQEMLEDKSLADPKSTDGWGYKEIQSMMYKWLNPEAPEAGLTPKDVSDIVEDTVDATPTPDFQVPDVNEGVSLVETDPGFEAGVALVQKGDGVTDIFARQFESRAEEFGFTGSEANKKDWALKEAVKLAKRFEFIKGADELRLSGEATDALAIPIEKQADGSLGIKFIDVATGKEVSDAQLDAMTYKYSPEAVSEGASVDKATDESPSKQASTEKEGGFKYERTQNDYKQILLSDPEDRGYSGWNIKEKELIAQGKTAEEIAVLKQADIEAWAEEYSRQLYEEDRASGVIEGGSSSSSYEKQLRAVKFDLAPDEFKEEVAVVEKSLFTSIRRDLRSGVDVFGYGGDPEDTEALKAFAHELAVVKVARDIYDPTLPDIAKGNISGSLDRALEVAFTAGEELSEVKVYGYGKVSLEYDPNGSLDATSVDNFAKQLKGKHVAQASKLIASQGEVSGDEIEGVARKIGSRLMLLDRLKKDGETNGSTYKQLAHDLYRIILTTSDNSNIAVKTNDVKIAKHIGKLLNG